MKEEDFFVGFRWIETVPLERKYNCTQEIKNIAQLWNNLVEAIKIKAFNKPSRLRKFIKFE